MFLAEGREHLQELNLAVVRIEDAPEDRTTVDEIFRIAHSLKGMSATMGFGGMAALTHEMEDVFELLRQRRNGLQRNEIDVLLECLDALAAALDAIDETGSEAIEPATLIERLRALVRDDEAAPERSTGDDIVEPPFDLSEMAQGRRVVQVGATLRDDVEMPAVRAYMVLAAVAKVGETLACLPAPQDVDTFAGRDIVAWLVSDRTDAELEAAAAGVPDVVAVDVVEAVADAAVDGEPEQGPAVVHERSRASSTVRVDSERLDALMHAMGELVLNRTQVEVLANHADVPGLAQAIQGLTRTSHALQAMVMQVRMIPVEAVLLRFPRLVRDLSVKLSKQVELELVGRDTELDRSVVDSLGDPLVHLIRNALDHGLETPSERLAAGKPETGKLEIAARHAGGNVLISVSDDGRGIDAATVARKAAERGLITHDAVASIDLARATELLFHPGFSTMDVTSDVSGRGVGMDAVRVAIRELGGDVTLSSEPGAGTRAEIRLPLTLAIMSALIVHVDGRPFAIPLDRIERIVRLPDHPVSSIAGRRMLVLSDGALPLVDGAEQYGGTRAEDPAYAVVVRGNGDRLAFAVGALDGQRELVTRPLPPEISEGSALSGAAVLSDGQIALIVDCDAVAHSTQLTLVTGAAA
jgi:two-component system chemotaxis sensor kinase CheA